MILKHELGHIAQIIGAFGQYGPFAALDVEFYKVHGPPQVTRKPRHLDGGVAVITKQGIAVIAPAAEGKHAVAVVQSRRNDINTLDAVGRKVHFKKGSSLGVRLEGQDARLGVQLLGAQGEKADMPSAIYDKWVSVLQLKS